MKVSYHWLQTYFKDPLPKPEELVEHITFHVFEVEGIEKKGTDTILDIKVLPDRAPYALCHRGIAYEIAAILKQEKNDLQLPQIEATVDKKVSVAVEDSALCPRYTTRFMEGVAVGESPAWIKERLEAVGQRSINIVVDAANFVMLDMGQPLHAFDADKVVGGITVRCAREGEKITTLDNKEITLDPSILIIADDEAPLAIAGVKGGKKAEVTKDTKNIIIESANFNASLIRRTSQKVGIRNDASKRYENTITPAYTEWGIQEVTKLISENTTVAAVGPCTDIYLLPTPEVTIPITSQYISTLLGVAISDKEIEETCMRLDIRFVKESDAYLLTPPAYRLDLAIPQDIAEEIGRLHDYRTLPATLLSATSFAPHVEPVFYYSNKIRDVLVAEGYSEVYTYSLKNKGVHEIQNPLASDKKFLRENLSDGVTASLELNTRNADFLALDQIKIFEIGSVFTKKGEEVHLALGVQNAKKLKIKEADELERVRLVLSEMLDIDIQAVSKTPHILEINLDQIIAESGVPDSYEPYESLRADTSYVPISPYPFAVRDIAVFVPEGVPEDELRKVIEQKAGKLLVRNTLFDVFKKPQEDGTVKTSYAFRLVLQSREKTLTDEEIKKIIDAVTEDFNGRSGWQVR